MRCACLIRKPSCHARRMTALGRTARRYRLRGSDTLHAGLGHLRLHPHALQIAVDPTQRLGLGRAAPARMRNRLLRSGIEILSQRERAYAQTAIDHIYPPQFVRRPVRGAITSAGISAFIDEAFQQHRRVTIARWPVRRNRPRRQPSTWDAKWGTQTPGNDK